MSARFANIPKEQQMIARNEPYKPVDMIIREESSKITERLINE
jgi:hypothetical protein